MSANIEGAFRNLAAAYRKGGVFMGENFTKTQSDTIARELDALADRYRDQ